MLSVLFLTLSSFCLLSLQFSAFAAKGRDSVWPSLLHNANSSQLRVWLDNVLPRSNQSRFALELQSVSSGEQKGQVDVLKSIDDEYTPSIFKVRPDFRLPVV